LKTFLIILLLLIPVFGIGVYVGYYETFPLDIVKSIKNSNTSNSNLKTINDIPQNSISELISIKSYNDATLKRSQLINYIWKSDSLPEDFPYKIEKNFVSTNFQNIENLKYIEKIHITQILDVNSYPYLFIPIESNNKLIIYHHGHDGDFTLAKNYIISLINDGFSVLAFSMPLTGNNNTPIVNHPNFGKLQLSYHDDLELFASNEFSPIKLFLEPIIISLNYVDENYDFESYSMIGISGGGWTTLLSAAIDERISKSYSVAGSLPFFMRTNLQDLGDFEQRDPSLYQITNYLELYIMAGSGQDRKHIQILNKNDPCCFSVSSQPKYVDEIQKLQSLPLDFELWIDESHNEHKISTNIKKMIQISIEE
jgi:hypothetical protein